MTQENQSGSSMGNLPSRSLVFLAYIAVIISWLILFVGGFLLHGWTTYLFYKHWGPFWALCAFTIPPISEVFACVMCFGWHVWYFILAVVIYVIAAFGLSFASIEENTEFRPTTIRLALSIWLLLLAGVSICFTNLAMKYSFGPTVQTAFAQSQIEDCAAAIIVTIRASDSRNPEELAQVVSAKKELKSSIRGFNSTELNQIQSIVNTNLKCEAYVCRDLIRYIEQSRRGIRIQQFLISTKVKSEISKMPVSMRKISNESMQSLQDNITKEIGTNASQLPGDWKERMQQKIGQTWTLYGNTYRDLFSQPMPTLDSLTADYFED